MANKPKSYSTYKPCPYEEKIRQREYNLTRYDKMPHHKIYNTQAWKDKRNEVVKEECEQCGSQKNLRVHHIIPIDVNPDLALDNDNLRTLCERCHKVVHSERQREQRERDKENEM
jgi:5-methylcytosine-specific restriction enzyme A